MRSLYLLQPSSDTLANPFGMKYSKGHSHFDNHAVIEGRSMENDQLHKEKLILEMQELKTMNNNNTHISMRTEKTEMTWSQQSLNKEISKRKLLANMNSTNERVSYHFSDSLTCHHVGVAQIKAPYLKVNTLCETVVSYELPNPAQAKFTVMDITGKVIAIKTVDGQAGTNKIGFTKAELGGASGVLIYRIESDKFSAQRKMIVIE